MVSAAINFKFKRPLNMLIISVQAVPPITLLIPYFGLIVALRLFNTYAALVLTYMVFTLPYAILMMTGYFNTLPKELDEAVMMDGGSSVLRSGACWCRFRCQGLSPRGFTPSCRRGTNSSLRSR
jgi:ABC-type glycerol-3-phosphate transport system permease component